MQLFRKDFCCLLLMKDRNNSWNWRAHKHAYRQSGPHSRSAHPPHVEVRSKQSDLIINSSKSLQAFKQLRKRERCQKAAGDNLSGEIAALGLTWDESFDKTCKVTAVEVGGRGNGSFPYSTRCYQEGKIQNKLILLPPACGQKLSVHLRQAEEGRGGRGEEERGRWGEGKPTVV